MFTAPNSLVKLILDSKALSIWNRETGPAFWWTSNLPAPFYLRTEVMIGSELADDLLKKIDTAIATQTTPPTRADELNNFMMDAYRQSPNYKTVIQAMVDVARSEFPIGSYSAVSGGERRDWIFSIPFASEVKVKHIYLFKDKSAYCKEALHAGEKVLHVSDIISKAASYFNLWLPALAQADLICAGTVSVNAHGTTGTAKLEEAGYKTCPVNRIDLSFFLKCYNDKLIDDETMDEIKMYLTSERDWTDLYIMENPSLLNITTTDKKTLDRMKTFFTQDPWSLRGKHSAYFDKMLAAINKASN